MSAPSGYAASNSTEGRLKPPCEPAATPRWLRSTYLQGLALRRETAAIRRQSVYGLVMGWVLTLVAGFLFFCVPSRLDGLWAVLMGLGGLHLAAAVLLPQSLAWPERAWIGVARWQGWLVMTILLTIVYFMLIWPASYFSRRRTLGFVLWDRKPPQLETAWEKFDLAEVESMPASGNRYRSLPLLLAALVAFFFRRGNYVLLPILILLIVLGLVLYFVQSSALAPFIYTIF